MGENSILRYNSARLFGQSRTAGETINPISLVTDFDFGFSLNRQLIKSVGYSEIIRPVVSNQRPYFNFSYFLSDVDNEKLFRMPVTADEAVHAKIPIFTGLETMDFMFLSSESGQDFVNIDENELSACFFTGAFMTSYNLEILNSGVIKISTSWEADNVRFEKFKNISEYKFIDFDVEDLEMTTQSTFELNDGKEEINLDVGGFGTQGRMQSFSFSADIPTKTLYDFGQYAHKKDIKFPIEGRISTRAFVNKQIEGRLDNILCSDKGVDFLFSNFRNSCKKGNIKNDKSGFLFKDAKIESQKYSLSTSKGNYFVADLEFTVYITREKGVYIAKHITPATDAIFQGEDGFEILNLMLESEGGAGGILSEVAGDMISSMKDLRNKV
ncbi:MAG: hypothetical protein P8P37_02450 [Candidatus Marinimicrobia bacterium]|nr:hypothetical protein [Candidatus Neomarinimicrobiota bacterium]